MPKVLLPFVALVIAACNGRADVMPQQATATPTWDAQPTTVPVTPATAATTTDPVPPSASLETPQVVATTEAVVVTTASTRPIPTKIPPSADVDPDLEVISNSPTVIIENMTDDPELDTEALALRFQSVVDLFTQNSNLGEYGHLTNNSVKIEVFENIVGGAVARSTYDEVPVIQISEGLLKTPMSQQVWVLNHELIHHIGSLSLLDKGYKPDEVYTMSAQFIDEELVVELISAILTYESGYSIEETPMYSRNLEFLLNNNGVYTQSYAAAIPFIRYIQEYNYTANITSLLERYIQIESDNRLTGGRTGILPLFSDIMGRQYDNEIDISLEEVYAEGYAWLLYDIYYGDKRNMLGNVLISDVLDLAPGFGFENDLHWSGPFVLSNNTDDNMTFHELEGKTFFSVSGNGVERLSSKNIRPEEVVLVIMQPTSGSYRVSDY